MRESKSTSSSGASTIGILGVSFVVLKLTGFIDWSWWWVTAPFWGGIVLLIAITAAYFVYLRIAFPARRKP